MVCPWSRVLFTEFFVVYAMAKIHQNVANLIFQIFFLTLLAQSFKIATLVGAINDHTSPTFDFFLSIQKLYYYCSYNISGMCFLEFSLFVLNDCKPKKS